MQVIWKLTLYKRNQLRKDAFDFLQETFVNFAMVLSFFSISKIYKEVVKRRKE